LPYQILIADDHPLFRSALKESVQQALKSVNVIEVDTVTELQVVAAEYPESDLVLLDLLMPDAKGFSGLAVMRGQFPSLPVVVISALESLDVIQRSFAHGASGFIPKSASLSTITQAIRSVLDGQIWAPPGYQAIRSDLPRETVDFSDRLAILTPKQFQVLGMICEGLLNKQIAYELGISEATIKAHSSALFKKLDVSNRTQLVIAMQQLEVLPPKFTSVESE